MKNLRNNLILTSAFGILSVVAMNAQSSGKVITNAKTTDVTTTIHEPPSISIHEPPAIEIHEPPAVEIHDPGFDLFGPGLNNQGPEGNNSDKIKLKLYPNPAVDIINISSEHYHFKAFSIYNNSGVILDKGVFEIQDHIAQLNISQLQKGLYILVIQADHGQIAVKRFVKN